ncbi:hypothetical protein EDD16DRAFT_886235 [Pisolithus croceorrhizus]|nr:hypothetical protein EDD16DRAFT_886235 [Pisolithus croceorrhizus]
MLSSHLLPCLGPNSRSSHSNHSLFSDVNLPDDIQDVARAFVVPNLLGFLYLGRVARSGSRISLVFASNLSLSYMVVLLAYGYLVKPFLFLHTRRLWRYEFSQWIEGYETVWQISRERVRPFPQFLILQTLLEHSYHLPEFCSIPPSGSSPMQCRPPGPYLA